MFDLTHAPSDLHGDSCVRPRALPDSFHAELAASFPDRHGDYTPAQEAEMYAQWQASQAARRDVILSIAVSDDGDRTPPAGAMFPEVVTWSDDDLIRAIELADDRDASLNLAAIGDLPDRYEQLLHEASAELVRRLEASGVRLAA